MEKLKTNRLNLRKLRMEDAEKIEFYASDYDIAKTTLNIPHPYPEGAGVLFVENTLEAYEKGEIYTFVMEDKRSQEFIGLMGLNVNSEFNHGELGYWIGKPFWRKGYGTEAAKRVMEFGFEHLHLNKVFARAFAHNPASWRIMEKIGLTHEGTFKEHIIRFGEYVDVVFYGMLKREYEMMKE